MNPTNVFMNGNDPDTIKILDFNVSKLVENYDIFNDDHDEEVKHTEERKSEPRVKARYSLFTKTGTPLYSAPEI